jgi:RHS repeat-associated protein
MGHGYWDTREPAIADFNSSLTVTTDYLGNKVYVNNQLKYILTEEGYIEKNGTAYNAYYYLNDRLGNHRIVTDASGVVKQVNNFYPSGTSMAERRTDQGVQPYKFGGKELDRTNTMDVYDFEARNYDPVLMRFTRPDPLAEKYPSISPYVYCLNNPVRFVDRDGRRPGDVVVAFGGAYFLKTGGQGLANTIINLITQRHLQEEGGVGKSFSS